MKELLAGTNKNKDLKRLNKLERKFTGSEKAINGLENKLQMCKESKMSIWNLNKKPIKITKLGHMKDCSTKYLFKNYFIWNANFSCLVMETTKKLDTQIYYFGELEYEISLSIIQ